MNTIAIVGASLAGLHAAEALREAGFDGTLTLIGAEQRLPYDRPPLSKQVLAGDREPEETALREDARYDELGLDLRLGRTATALDLETRELELEGGERVPFDGLLIATGASPRVLPDTPPLEGIFTLRTLDDCVALRAAFDARPRVAVIGAGFIGSEVAATARGRGLDVTLIEAAPVPLVRAVGESMGRVCAALHLEHSVDLRLGTGVQGFEGSSRVEGVRLADGTVVPADVAVVGVGVAPNSGWLESSALTIDNGVVCDQTCAAAAPDVYAAGDVARWHNRLFDQEMRVEHWTNAIEQGRAAAQNLLAGADDAQPFAPVPYFWSDQYDVKIQFVGYAQPEDAVRVAHGSVEEHRFVALYGRSGRLVAALGFNWARLVMAYRMQIEQRASWEDALTFAEAENRR